MHKRKFSRLCTGAFVSLSTLFLVCGQWCLMTSAAPDSDALLETGRAAEKTRAPAPAPAEIRVVQYNIRWRGGDDLRELIKLLKDDREIGGAAVIALQEVDRHKKRTNYTNTAQLIAQELGMNYAWAAPPCAVGKEREEEETGVALLSPYPLTDARRIVLPNEGPKGRRRVALGATVHIGTKSIRVYSVHAETRTTNEKRLEQFKAVLDDLQSHQAAVAQAIVLGDFNTITGKDVDSTSRLFKERGLHTPFPDDLATWKTFIIELKLDWFWLHGLDATAYGIDKEIGLSDHWPLWAVVKMKDEKR